MIRWQGSEDGQCIDFCYGYKRNVKVYDTGKSRWMNEWYIRESKDDETKQKGADDETNKSACRSTTDRSTHYTGR